MNRRIVALALLACALAPGHLVAADKPAADRCQIVENFTGELPSSATIDFAAAPEARVGLGAAAASYSWDAGEKKAVAGFPDRAMSLSGPGTLRLWVKGDGSRNVMQLVLMQAREGVEGNGRRYLHQHREARLAPVVLDFSDWREIELDAKGLQPDMLTWWQRLEFSPGKGDDRPKSGTVLLDDLRLYPTAPMATGAVAVRMIGPAVRDLGGPIALGLDVRNFSDRTGVLHARVTMVDRNQNQVLDRDFAVPVAAGESKETRLDLDPQQLAAFLPPFQISGDVLGAELPDLAQRIDQTLVVANGVLLYTAMGDALGQWFAAGNAEAPDRLKTWLMGAGQRASPLTQTTARLERSDIPEAEAAAAATANPGARPLGRFALDLAYSGDATAYRGADRWIPGNAFAIGLWVKGDGSGGKLTASVLDFSDLSDFWEGGWKRSYSELPLCTLDFTGWRWIEVALPGGGRGTNLPRGSTQDFDFPFELTCLRVRPPAVPAGTTPAPLNGVVRFGSIYARTQIATAETLSVHLAYDDAEQRFAADRGAWVTVHNGAPTTARQVAGRWELLDRNEKVVGTGTFTAALKPGEAATSRIDLGPGAAGAEGPLTLVATASDAKDATVTASRAVVLSKPDSVVLHADFESDRGYLGLKAEDLPWTPEAGQPAAATTTALAHGGSRSLAIPWSKAGHPAVWVAIDPALPGLPTAITMWVHGDGSGALFHPVIGDRPGITHGVGTRTFDLFLVRTDGALQNAVRIDWKGWRQLTFRLPPVPPAWVKDTPVRPYLPSYPLGLHLAVDGRDSAADGGVVNVDDIEVATHLVPEARVTLSAQREGLPDIVPAGTVLHLRLANSDRGAKRTVRIVGGAVDAAGTVVAAPPAGDLELAPGEVRIVDLPALPAGAFALRLKLLQGTAATTLPEEDLIVGDPAPLLGAEWATALADEWKLRTPLADPAVLIDEDWDWVERFPGNIQLDTMRGRAARAVANGTTPWMLLGYSAYWAAGIGLQQLESSSFVRAPRDIGHGVDIFLVPERAEHWRDYVSEVMRGVGDRVGGFVLWDNPDGTSSLALPPAKLADFATEADRWRTLYCPQTPLIVGGMAQATALPYLAELAKAGGTAHVGGVNVRFDLGRQSPEDGRIADFARDLVALLDPEGTRKPVLYFTDLDWAVERGDGLDAFTQAAYLVRSELALRPLGIAPALTVRNGDYARVGQGLAYRTTINAPPLKEQVAGYLLKPGWWALARARALAAATTVVASAEVADTMVGRTRALLLRRTADGKAVVMAWRNEERGPTAPTGRLSLGGLPLTSAEDCFGGTVAAQDGWLPVGPVPLVLVLDAPAERVDLAQLRVRDGATAQWPQRPLARIEPQVGGNGFRQRGGEPATLAGTTAEGREASWPGLRFATAGGEEAFRVSVPAGEGVVLRHRYLLDKTGFTARIAVDGTAVGEWDLRHAEPELRDGLRESLFVIPAAAFAGKATAEITATYAGAATSAGWTVFAYAGGGFPLATMGAIHADQAVGHPRAGRNLIGAPLKIADQGFADGVAVYADSLLEYPLAKGFTRFRAKVGVDAATDGRGSVVFEVLGDGKSLWKSPVLSGLDAARAVDVDITGVDRLRLVVRDGGDGNRFDAADWCDAELTR